MSDFGHVYDLVFLCADWCYVFIPQMFIEGLL